MTTIDIYDFSFLIAIGILIGLSLVLSYFSEEKISLISLLIYMTIINSFLVSTGFLPIWTEILFLLIIVGLGVMQYQKSKGSG